MSDNKFVIQITKIVGGVEKTYNLPLPSNWGNQSYALPMTVEMITKDAERSSNGVLTSGLTVNIGLTMPVEYAKLSVDEMKDLCEAGDYIIPNYDESFTNKTIADRTMRMTCITPSGVKESNVYFSDQLKCSLHFKKALDEGFSLDADKWKEYVEWKDVSFDIVYVGVGSSVGNGQTNN